MACNGTCVGNSSIVAVGVRKDVTKTLVSSHPKKPTSETPQSYRARQKPELQQSLQRVEQSRNGLDGKGMIPVTSLNICLSDSINNNSLSEDSKTENSSEVLESDYTSCVGSVQSEPLDVKKSSCASSGSVESINPKIPSPNQYPIPRILLEPPSSGNDNSAFSSTEDLLDLPPSQNGFLSANLLYSSDLERHQTIMALEDRLSALPSPAQSEDTSETFVTLPDRYQRRLQVDMDNSALSEEDLKSDAEDDMCSREEDLGTALKWIRQEILEMKEQDKSLLKQFIELRASILQLRCLYDPDLQGSCSDISSVGSGSTYSLNEPGLAHSISSSNINKIHVNSSSSNISKIHINSSSSSNVLKSPHQLRRMLLLGGGGELGGVGRREGGGVGLAGSGGGGVGGAGGMVSLSLPNSPRIARLRWRSDEII
ncbi:hypothetical protein PoB_003734900 [Plakobranchus ocellatus]|uniref:Uncharacterized protein n=1 Tax=Plakobranchus ocellatus TaxID=259542 RepID=A0AAV4AXI5_9GAST|nr:hypothetical protein PoB_003734900 [Plakobranchus ocellatus]